MESLNLKKFEYIDKLGNMQVIFKHQIEKIKHKHYLKKPDGSIIKIIVNDFNQDKPDDNIKEF